MTHPLLFLSSGHPRLFCITKADRSQPNYNLRLTGGQSITHTPFVVPDWGALRFDVHAPSFSGGRLLVTLEAADGSGVQASTWVDLVAANGDIGEYANDTHRIDYGRVGFETFTLNVPNNLRGKLATLMFSINSGEVYLDDVFFKPTFRSPFWSLKN
jgi:hypothetical protein